ncbi:MAG: PAS domain S-box protein, partial [candidate division Zixibacteria bacterium]|nr:PAS domain S-box protein [candidate division Zixibacteria bacterium]
ADALYYTEALEQTQVGYLAQKMAHEEGVEYIIYQTTEGIVFSSRRAGELLAIESDPFLADALESEHIASRRYNFHDQEVLELVRPFSTADYPFGLLRVGLSLENYQSIIRGYHYQMITLAVILFSLVLVVVMYSNSRRKRAEIARKYKRIKSISDTIFENMRTGVAALDAHGKIVLANDAFESILHLHNVDGKQWNTAVTEPLLSFEAISPGSGVSHELELEIGHEGAKKSLLIAVSRMFAESEGLQGLVVVVYDITRIKELEAKSARRERLSEMGNLAAGVAHEIRNPLNTISIAAQRLAAEYAPTEQSDEFLSFTRQIKEETRRLNEIITRFLALTREDRESRTSVDLSRLITEFIQFIMPEAQDLGIVVKAGIESGLTISAGPDNVKQILSNLYNNAKEALTGRAGEITIAARKHRGQVLLEFADNGPGIDPTLREKAFTPYYTTKEAGTGLGLPTVYRIVSDLGGDIRIEQSETGGVSIVINFPV